MKKYLLIPLCIIFATGCELNLNFSKEKEVEKAKELTNQSYKGVVYIDPTDLSKKCTKEMAQANRNDSEYGTYTGVNTGCMTFYVYDDSGSTYKMILNHNTSGDVAWNSQNKSTMKEVKERLLEDTEGWVGNPRLISAEEIASIVGVKDLKNFSTGFSFGAKEDIDYHDQTESQKRVHESYAWLFENLHESDKYSSLGDTNSYPYGTKNSENKYYVMGYWTSTVRSISSSGVYVWHVIGDGAMYSISATNSKYAGVRPVIELSKDLVEINV